MKDILLINEELLKEYCIISDNVDIKDIVPYVLVAQQLHIRRIIGSLLYNELQLAIKDDDLTPEQSDLIVKIAPCLSYYAIYEELPFHWAKYVNKGITKMESDNSSSLALNELQYLRAQIKVTAQQFEAELINFLCDCAEDYPSWTPPEGCGCKAHDEGSSEVDFSTQIYFPKTKNKCGCKR